MDQKFRTQLAEELSAAPEPPIGDLVAGSIRRGRRLRVVRRLRFGGIALAVLAVTTGAVLVQRPGGGTGGSQVGAPPVVTSPWAKPAGAPATGPLVPATPGAVLELLLSLLPEGPTSAYGGNDEGGILVQTYLDTGSGPGMLRVAVGRTFAEPTPQAGALCRDACESAAALPQSTTTLPDGGVATVTEIPDNCVQRTVVTVRHADGTEVQVNIASCLAWDGTANQPAPQALTVEQATAIAGDARWGTRMAKSLVDAGALHFPGLPAVG